MSAEPVGPLYAFIGEVSPVIRENLIAALEEMAPLVVVGTAADKAGAVHWLCDPHHACDLAIVDLFLQAGSGLGVLRALQRCRPGLHCVALTNYASDDMRRACTSLGASRVFDKSGEIDDLVDHCIALSTYTATT